MRRVWMLPLVSARFSSDSATRRTVPRFAPACPARARLSSSRNATSSTQCNPFSIPQWLRMYPATALALTRRLVR